VLLAMGFSPEVAGSGLRISLGSWNRPEHLSTLPQALAEAQEEVASAAASAP
jgi:cysteine sulfinate desulfinase/cysteine desulfurase-like protein